jgi:glutathione S-transferase
VVRPERYATDKSAHPNIQETGRAAFRGYLEQIDGMFAGRQWLSESYSVLDPYAFVFYLWGTKRAVPMDEMKNYAAFKDRMLERPAVVKILEKEGQKL